MDDLIQQETVSEFCTKMERFLKRNKSNENEIIRFVSDIWDETLNNVSSNKKYLTGRDAVCKMFETQLLNTPSKYNLYEMYKGGMPVKDIYKELSFATLKLKWAVNKSTINPFNELFIEKGKQHIENILGSDFFDNVQFILINDNFKNADACTVMLKNISKNIYDYLIVLNGNNTHYINETPAFILYHEFGHLYSYKFLELANLDNDEKQLEMICKNILNINVSYNDIKEMIANIFACCFLHDTPMWEDKFMFFFPYIVNETKLKTIKNRFVCFYKMLK